MRFYLNVDTYRDLVYGSRDYLLLFVNESDLKLNFIGYTYYNDLVYMLFGSADRLFIFEVTTDDFVIFTFTQVSNCSKLYSDVKSLYFCLS